jgi:hypothetical protein
MSQALTKKTNQPAGGIRLLQLGLMAAVIGVASPALANHSVLVEGEADFDGDGMLGMDEDNDADQVFGTLNGGLNGVGFNGRVVVVTSGRFFEQVVIDPNGILVLEGAPGVTVDIEAFNAGGDPDANVTRQNQPGVIVMGDGSFPVEIRNVVSRNWTIGFLVTEQARVTIDGVLADSNVDYGIQVLDSAKVLIKYTQVNSSGFRASGTEGVVPANPGRGIEFDGRSFGTVAHTEVTHSADKGFANKGRGKVRLVDVVAFDNDGGGNDYFDDDHDGDRRRK